MTGIERIAAERKRQIEVEGFTAEADEGYLQGELAQMAACYALPNITRETPMTDSDWEDDELYPLSEHLWPLNGNWKPTPGNRIRELEKAGALIAAEIDRLLRLEEKKNGRSN
jgi:hypothetical protein